MGAISESVVTKEDPEIVELCDKLRKFAITDDDSDDESWDEFVQQFLDPMADPTKHEHTVYSTGIPKLDDHLGRGGLTSGTVNEFMGFTTCGKTYLTHSILANIVCERQVNALIITNSSVQSVYTSLRSILESNDGAPGLESIDHIIQRIKVQSFGDIYELSRILRNIIESGTELMRSHKILLLDGLSSEFLQHYMKRNKRFLRRMYTNIRRIRRLANNHDTLVIVTNVTVSRNRRRNRKHPPNATVVSYSQVTSRDWPLFMHNRYLLHRTESLNPNYPDYLVHVKVIKSLWPREGGLYCFLKLTEQGFK